MMMMVLMEDKLMMKMFGFDGEKIPKDRSAIKDQMLNYFIDLIKISKN